MRSGRSGDPAAFVFDGLELAAAVCQERPEIIIELSVVHPKRPAFFPAAVLLNVAGAIRLHTEARVITNAREMF